MPIDVVRQFNNSTIQPFKGIAVPAHVSKFPDPDPLLLPALSSCSRITKPKIRVECSVCMSVHALDGGKMQGGDGEIK